MTELKLRSSQARLHDFAKIHAQLHLLRHHSSQLEQEETLATQDQYLVAANDLANTLSILSHSERSKRIKALEYSVVLYSTTKNVHQTVKAYKFLVELQEAEG